MQRTRNCHQLGSWRLLPGWSQPDSANLEFSLALLWGCEAVPNRAVACALCTGCGPLPQQQYDRPTWWRQCHLGVNWQTRSRSRNFGRGEWQVCALVQRCAVLIEPDRRVASISKTIECGQGSLWERRQQACDVVLHKDE